MSDVKDFLMGYGAEDKISEFIENIPITVDDIKTKSKNELLKLGLSEHVVEAIQDTKRKPIPEKILNQVLHESAFTCVVCRNISRSVIVHHLDKYSKTKSNLESNLVVLCTDHHNEAHTKHELTRNLTKARIIEMKSKWLKEVAENKKIALLRSIQIEEDKGNKNYVYYIDEKSECPNCKNRSLKFEGWERSQFGNLSLCVKCSNCKEIYISQEQFGD